MAGSLPGIPLSQQFSAIGKPLSGCLLYFYAANSTTPQDSFQDQGLTIKNPWPLAADSSGRVPMFYLADGSVHVRLTDNTGVVQFDYPSMLVIGPSSGSGGGGGGGVDPTTVFQTGDVMWLDVQGLRTGWVRDNGRTIGNGTSGASERANADCQNLFVYLWTNKDNTQCPVTGGRGATGLADFNAGKQIQLPDKRGCLVGGVDDMGNAAAGRFATVPFPFGNSTFPGAIAGENIHTLTLNEAPVGQFTINLTDSGHKHFVPGSGGGGHTSGLSGNDSGGPVGGVNSGPNDTTGISVSLTDHAGGQTHNNVPFTILGTFFRKL